MTSANILPADFTAVFGHKTVITGVSVTTTEKCCGGSLFPIQKQARII
jgi:hypothetical protein